MQKICAHLRATVSNLSEFSMGKIDAPKLKVLLFGPLDQDKPIDKAITNVSQKIVKRSALIRIRQALTPVRKMLRGRTLIRISPSLLSARKMLRGRRTLTRTNQSLLLFRKMLRRRAPLYLTW
uniref:Uncharacterized protein n=1 Tax=Arundo donax TaxID=35708 RepID=A0A0A9BEY6_ARUDO